MNAIKFDRNRIRGILADANVSKAQTDVVVKAMEDGIRVESTDLATGQGLEDVKKELKQDIGDVKKELKQDIEDIKKDLKHEIAGLEARTTAANLRAQITTIVATVGLTSTVVGVMIAIVQTFS